MLDRTQLVLILTLAAAALSGCDSGGDTPAQIGDLRPDGSIPQPPDPPAQDPPAGGPGGGSPSGIGQSCSDPSDSNHQCIGVKIISYVDSSGNPTLSKAQAATLIEGVNSIWKACNIAFQVDRYESVDPTTLGLSYGSSSQNETTEIRNRFSDSDTFLLAITGPWNTSTIAWTQLPGAEPYGAIVEKDFGTSKVTVAHEFGHYMGLDHNGTVGNVMYYIVYSTDTAVSSSQCSAVRSNNERYWRSMLR